MSTPVNHPQITALINGDRSVMRILYNTLCPKFTSFVYKNNGDKNDAEEIFHKALYQIIARAKLKGIQINSSFEAYFFTVCKNLWYQELKNRKFEVRNDGVFELKSEDNHNVEEILNQERWELFDEMLNQLSGNCQKLLRDYFKKVGYDELIKKFNYSSKNVAFQRIFKCKKKLTELIKNDERFKNL